MSNPLPSPAVTLSGYSRTAVEAYFAAAETERARLCDAIDAERRRLERARAAIDAGRVLAAMVEQACDEITAKRRQGELVVQRVAAARDGSPPIRWRSPMALESQRPAVTEPEPEVVR